MEKSILITGSQGSGKTTKAKRIARQFAEDEVVIIPYQMRKKIHGNPFLFMDCTQKTKLVIFEELFDINQVEAFFDMVSNPITVNKQSQEPFTISPKFVLVCQTDIPVDQLVKIGTNILRRFDVVHYQNGEVFFITSRILMYNDPSQ